MKTRIISGIAMVPFLIFVFLGNYWLAALGIFISFVGVREFYNGFRHMGHNPMDKIAYVMLFVLYFIHGLWPGNMTLVMGWLTVSIMACSIGMFQTEKHTPMDAMITMVGIVYIIFFVYHIVLIDQNQEFRVFRWLALLCAFGSDIFAYFVGVTVGKHKLCPALSPKKSVEGLIGGLVGSSVCCLIFGYFVMPEYMVSCAIIGFFGAAISVCGDLTASAYKRKMGIKDYGNLIPGHGGIMDRFDSVIFTAPFVYYYIVIVLEHFQLGL